MNKECLIKELEYLEKDLIPNMETLQSQIYTTKNKINKFMNSFLYQNFLVFLNFKELIKDKREHYKNEKNKLMNNEASNYTVTFKSVNYISKKLELFFSNVDTFYFFNKNLYDSFFLYCLKNIENLTDLKNINTIIHDNKLKKK